MQRAQKAPSVNCWQARQSDRKTTQTYGLLALAASRIRTEAELHFREPEVGDHILAGDGQVAAQQIRDKAGENQQRHNAPSNARDAGFVENQKNPWNVTVGRWKDVLG